MPAKQKMFPPLKKKINGFNYATFHCKTQTELMIYHNKSIQFVFSPAICSRSTVQNTGTDVESTVKIPPVGCTAA